MRTSKNKTNKKHEITNLNASASKGRKTRTQRKIHTRTQKRKRKEKIFKGGNNPFSDIMGMWGTMTYNLSNAFSVFTITPPSGYLNQSSAVSNPSPSKQFV
jgi:hypothetical protein